MSPGPHLCTITGCIIDSRPRNLFDRQPGGVCQGDRPHGHARRVGPLLHQKFRAGIPARSASTTGLRPATRRGGAYRHPLSGFARRAVLRLGPSGGRVSQDGPSPLVWDLCLPNPATADPRTDGGTLLADPDVRRAPPLRLPAMGPPTRPARWVDPRSEPLRRQSIPDRVGLPHPGRPGPAGGRPAVPRPRPTMRLPPARIPRCRHGPTDPRAGSAQHREPSHSPTATPVARPVVAGLDRPVTYPHRVGR